MRRDKRRRPRSGWRPLPGDSPEPRPVSESLDAFARRLGAADSQVLARLFAQWDTIAGQALAGHSRPLSLRDRVLVVAVDGGAWATQLNFLSAQLLDRVAEVAGERIADRVQVRVKPAGEA